jgi:hypothetical protein
VGGKSSSGSSASAGAGQICSGSTAAASSASATSQTKLTARWVHSGKATLTSRYGTRERVTGRLMTPSGQAISSVPIDVCATPTYEGGRSRNIASVRTGPTGIWSLTLPRDTPSSSLQFVYPGPADDMTPLATTGLELRVHAGVALRIAPHITSVDHTIHFSGTLHGTPIPAGGKQLVLEASSGGEWIQFDTITTNAHGHYHASYRFKFPGPVTYKFRVLAPHEADFPFLAGSSNIVNVYER